MENIRDSAGAVVTAVFELTVTPPALVGAASDSVACLDGSVNTRWQACGRHCVRPTKNSGFAALILICPGPWTDRATAQADDSQKGQDSQDHGARIPEHRRLPERRQCSERATGRVEWCRDRRRKRIGDLRDCVRRTGRQVGVAFEKEWARVQVISVMVSVLQCFRQGGSRVLCKSLRRDCSTQLAWAVTEGPSSVG